MRTTIYHGSPNIIEKPIFGYGNRNNDYGLGFYCTFNLDLAKEWSVRRGQDGYANCYEIESNGLNILDLNLPEYCLLHWLTILLKNREFETSSVVATDAKQYLVSNFSIPYEKYDVMIGYRADDSYFAFAQDFLNNGISYRQLCNAMYLGGLGQQFVLKSRCALDSLKFIGSELAPNSEWYHKKLQRDQAARQEYLNKERYASRDDDIYIRDIMREGMIVNDPRLR